MREIKFRGRVIDSADWEVGSLVRNGGFCRIVDAISETPVVPDSVGEFTGVLDVNGTEIYEGDIIGTKAGENDLSVVRYGEYLVYDMATMEPVDSSIGWYTMPLPDSVFADVEPFNLPAPLNKYWISYLEIKVVDNEFDRERRKLDVREKA